MFILKNSVCVWFEEVNISSVKASTITSAKNIKILFLKYIVALLFLPGHITKSKI